MSKLPAIFISSTYYDLKQVRAALRESLEKCGYRILASEHESFPVDPSLDTIQNCVRNVDNSADIFVLVIGGRYGCVDDSTSKSITNIEYEAARRKGIPVYAFIDRNVLHNLNTYVDNPSGDFSSVVDSVDVFKFIQKVRNTDKVWTREFDSPEDILGYLVMQLGYLFSDLLCSKLIINDPSNEWLRSLSPNSLKIATTQGRHWENYLLFQVMMDEIEKLHELRSSHKAGIVFGSGDVVTLSGFSGWVKKKMNVLDRIVDNLKKIMEVELPRAMGEPGVPGNPKEIVFVGRQLATAYKEAMLWSQDIQRASAEEELCRAVRAMSRFPEQMITELESFGARNYALVQANHNVGTRENPLTLDMKMTINLFNHEEYQNAMKELEERFSRGTVK
ncbi:MAG: DUF4062 domain-containing protein [Fimbriimonadaceae bacterium]|nr:MAG: DUF4062 domain-containing protein [Fimbriimonadaceae bacterium]